ncbi:YceH family protein [Lysobacter koreensis]|uniref:YceH family protein n=1 Tax=Lysobacter koreensis TaxID=266122 RepID=A0ABW2YL83_9GAMM
MPTHDDPSDALQLTAVEARIVASLVEKEATTPDTYPLTLNAIVLACNQKTAREPFLQLEPGEVGHALRQLESRGWVKSQHAARADRYSHRVEARLDLSRAHTALLALLMLRGPQTANELLARSERLAKFDSLADLQYALERLSHRDPALVRQLPRQGGRREDRYAHLLSGEPTYVAPAASATAATAASAGALGERVAALEARLADLESRLDAAGIAPASD